MVSSELWEITQRHDGIKWRIWLNYKESIWAVSQVVKVGRQGTEFRRELIDTVINPMKGEATVEGSSGSRARVVNAHSERERIVGQARRERHHFGIIIEGNLWRIKKRWIKETSEGKSPVESWIHVHPTWAFSYDFLKETLATGKWPRRVDPEWSL